MLPAQRMAITKAHDATAEAVFDIQIAITPEMALTYEAAHSCRCNSGCVVGGEVGGRH